MTDRRVLESISRVLENRMITANDLRAFYRHNGDSLPDFLRVPTRADLNFVPLPKPLPEPHYYRRELDRPRYVTGSEIIGLCATAAVIGFILGVYFAS